MTDTEKASPWGWAVAAALLGAAEVLTKLADKAMNLAEKEEKV